MALTPELIQTYGQAVACLQAGALDEAEALLGQVLGKVPDQAESLQLMGVLEQQRGRPVHALGWLDRAAAVQPANPDIALRIGVNAHQCGDEDRALAAFDRALALNPDLALAHNGRSIALAAVGRHDEAQAAMDAALALDPALISLHDMRVGERLKVCDWRGLDETRARLIATLDEGGLPCEPMDFMLLTADPARQQTLTRRFAARAYPASDRPLWTGAAYSHDRIRLALLTADIKDHPVAHQIAGVLETLDRTRFELSIHAWGGRGSGHTVRERIRAAADHFHDVQDQTPDAIAAGVRRQEADVVLALGGYTRNALPELLALRCAPVQVSYLGYPGTLGAPYVDYIVADETALPAAEAKWFEEAVAWMPATYHPTDDKAEIGAAPSRADLGLPGAAFVFCAYSQGFKIAPQMFDVWMRILVRTPGSFLWLADPGEHGQGNLRREAAARGVDPERLIFAGRVADRPGYVARFQTCDLMLDTLPYNAHSVASDALWAGLPVLTCPGTSFPGRVGAGLLRAVGLEALIAPDLEAYEELAVALAADTDRMAALRVTLAANRRTTALFDTAAYTRALGDALQTMVERQRRGLPPESFHVKAS